MCIRDRKYTPSPDGAFAGQHGYGYRSIEAFVEAAVEINEGRASVGDISKRDVLATIDATARVTAMLEAGRVSLDNGSRAVVIEYPDAASDRALDFDAEPVGIRLE